QIGGFFKAIALAAQTADQIIHIVPAVPQFALTGNFLAVPLLKRIDAGNVGDTSQHAFAVFVAQPAFDAEFVKQGGVDLVIAYTKVGKALGFLFNRGVFTHQLALRSSFTISQNSITYPANVPR